MPQTPISTRREKSFLVTIPTRHPSPGHDRYAADAVIDHQLEDAFDRRFQCRRHHNR